MNESPAEYVCEVHPTCRTTEPDCTTTNTMPGCVCQPEKPSGSYVTLNVATSASSLIWNFSRSVLTCWGALSVPMAGAVGCWPDGGVAKAYAANPAATAATANAGRNRLVARIASLLPMVDQ